MDAKSLITLLNFSRTLIQDGEIAYLFYERFPTSPDEVGKRLREIVAFREQELRDVHQDENPETLRKAIYENLEAEKSMNPCQSFLLLTKFVLACTLEDIVNRI